MTMSATGLQTDQVARRVAISHEVLSRADWATATWEREQPSEEAKLLALHAVLSDFHASMRAGRPDRVRLIRVAGTCQAWIEALDEQALDA